MLLVTENVCHFPQERYGEVIVIIEQSFLAQ